MSGVAIGLVGSGAVARAIGRAHVDARGTIAWVVSLHAERARSLAARLGAAACEPEDIEADVAAVVVAVSDRAVEVVGRSLAAVAGLRRVPVLHTSGALAGAALGPGLGVTGSLHPLQSFPRPADDSAAADALLARRLRGCHWFHEGGGAYAARALVAGWRGHFHSLEPGAKVLYHAAAAIVSNHSVALFDAATQILTAAGIDADDARAPLASLLAGTTENVRARGAVEALTGPVARGDVDTVERHLAALRTAAPHLVASYVETALLAVDVAVRRGSLDSATACRLRETLSRARRLSD